jgi:hypothetical protein
MQAENVEEYKGIRHEIEVLKGCITTYVGFVFLVVSPALWELTKAAPSGPNLPMAFVALALALGLKLVLFLLVYKFHSHNRYCGYCKLLEQEKFRKGDGVSAFFWEVCVDRLRLSDASEGLFKHINFYSGTAPTKEKLKERVCPYSGSNPDADRARFRKGWMLVVRSRRLFQSQDENHGTWHFPLYVARIFAYLDVGLLLVGLALLTPHDADGTRKVAGPPGAYVGYLLIWLLLAGLLLFAWQRILGRLYKIMCGSQTVDAFCWKFVAIHQLALKGLGLGHDYHLIGVEDHPPDNPGSSGT